jgi:hypothetical protein
MRALGSFYTASGTYVLNVGRSLRTGAAQVDVTIAHRARSDLKYMMKKKD